MIFGPRNDGTYIVEFQTSAGTSMVISIPRTETAVIEHFHARMPAKGFVVPDVGHVPTASLPRKPLTRK